MSHTGRLVYSTLRLPTLPRGTSGVRRSLFRGPAFLEPSIAATYWRIDTHLPATFDEKEQHWPNYFLFEPGMHFGVRS